MVRNTYHIKETKDGYKFTYSGNLKEVLEKARMDLKKIQAFIKCAEQNLELDKPSGAEN